MNKLNYWVSMLGIGLVSVNLLACNDGKEKDDFMPEGSFRHEVIWTMPGFEEEKDALLAKSQVDAATFIALSTDSAWALPGDKQKVLKEIRDGVSKPDAKTLLQKVIPLEDISTYMNNIYGGTVGGFVAEAADVKSLATMGDVYYGLRLDYDGTKFKPDGAGYAVIRYYSSGTSKFSIPYSPELGGTQQHAWPNGGGGFTTSSLGNGGYPEWVTNGYFAPEEGAELYEITPLGRELLRAVYKAGKWQTFESEYYPLPQTKSAQPDKVYEGINGVYAGYTFMVRGEVEGLYHLATYVPHPIPGLRVVEKGVYGLEVPVGEVTLLTD